MVGGGCAADRLTEQRVCVCLGGGGGGQGLGAQHSLAAFAYRVSRCNISIFHTRCTGLHIIPSARGWTLTGSSYPRPSSALTDSRSGVLAR